MLKEIKERIKNLEDAKVFDTGLNNKLYQVEIKAIEWTSSVYEKELKKAKKKKKKVK